MLANLLRSADAARVLGISKRTLSRWCAEHSVPHYKVGGTLLFDERELMEWVRDRHRVRVE